MHIFYNDHGTHIAQVLKKVNTDTTQILVHSKTLTNK
ncbi:hypothetical protein [Salmonella enterica]